MPRRRGKRNTMSNDRSWNVVELDFGGEETANFGTREESGTALFQVQTFATISQPDTDSASADEMVAPCIAACGSPSGLCVLTDKDASVFGDGCQSFTTSLSFESVIDQAAFTNELPFLVVGERSGTIHIVHTGLKRVLFSQALRSEDEECHDVENFKQISITEDEEGCHTLLLLTSQSIVRFSKVNLRKLDEVIQKGDFAAAKELQGQMVMDETDVSSVHTEGATDMTTLAISGQMHIVTTGGGNAVVALWRCAEKIQIRRKQKTNFLLAGSLTRCVVGGKYIFTTDEEQKLCCWNLLLIVVSVWPLRVRDFFVTEDNENNHSKPCFQLVMLTDSDTKGSHLKVYKVPSMQCTYTLAVGKVSTLAKTPHNQDSIMLIEGRNECDDDPERVTMVMVRCLMEALPETRFHRLLHKKQYEEAEKFAKLFNLDTDLVYRSKALSLLDQASTWSLPDPNDTNRGPMDLCDDMITCLEQIPDVEFVVGIASKAVFSDYEDVAKILQYGRTRLIKMKSKADGNNFESLLSMILDLLHKLATYGLVYGSSQYSPTSWDAFRHRDMWEELLHHAGRANLGRASVIWNRHKSDFPSVLSVDLLECLLRALPGDAPSHDIIPWLRDDIIPFICSQSPQSKKLLISWIEERATSLEVTEKALWPGNGLELVNLMIRGCQDVVTSADGGSGAVTFTETFAGNCRESLESLKDLGRGLQELLTLHKSYKCYLTFDQFRKETTESISFRMLERVAAVELVPGAIANCITPYARDHRLEVNGLLLKYIQDLLAVPSLFATYEASWEAKAIVVIRCITDLQSQCDAIYALMQKAPVPWSPGMEQLVQHGLSLNHPMVTLLKDRYKVMKLRDMFLKYDVQSVVLGDTDSLKIAVRSLLSRDTPGALADALRVVEAYPHQLCRVDAYLFRLQYLIKTGQVETCLETLSDLPAEEGLSFLSRILSWVEIVLDNEDQSKKLRLVVGQATERLLQADLYKDLPDTQADRLGFGQDIQAIIFLQREYNLLVTLSRFRDDACRAQLLKKAVMQHYKEMQAGVWKSQDCEAAERKIRALKPGNLVRILRLGEILGVPSSELRGEIALRAAQTGELLTAINICKDLSEPDCSPAVAHTLYLVCHTVCSQLADTADSTRTSPERALVLDLLLLIQKATASCLPDLLVDCADLCSRIHLLTRLSDQCESGDYGISVQIGAVETKKDPYQEYTFETFFQEDSLVLESCAAIPLAADFALACQPSPMTVKTPPLQHARIAGQPVLVLDGQSNTDEQEPDAAQTSYIDYVASSSALLVQMLREHNLCGLAIRTLQETLASAFVHLLVNKEVTHVQDQATTSAIEADVKRVVRLTDSSRQTLVTLSSTLLNKTFSCRHVDKFLALCYLDALPPRVAKEQIKKLVTTAGQNYKKIIAIAQVGCELARLNQDTQVLRLLEDLQKSALWGDRLLKIKVSFKEAFNSSEKKQALLPHLITHPDTSLDLITEYCRDFHLDEQVALVMYVQLLLLPSGNHGDAPRPLDKPVILKAVAMIQTKGSLIQMLSDNIDKIDCYDYERLRVVMSIIDDSGLDVTDQTHSIQVGLKLLDYLEAYTRTKPPSEYEVMFQQDQEEGGLMVSPKPLSPLSQTRLPFHPLLKGGQWKILCRELSEDTLVQLLPIAEVLRLSIDQLYVTTIQNIVKARQQRRKDQSSPTEKQGSDADTHPRVLCKLDLDTLNKVKDILVKVQQPEMAVVSARFIAKELPISKEKVVALQMCERFAHRWKELCHEGTPEHQKACATYQRLVAEQRAVSTEEALWRHGVAEAPYPSMASTPAKLIFQLYEHGSIEQRMMGVSHGHPDINDAVEEIAKINNCNLEKISLHLIEKWMPPPLSDKQDDTTLNFSFGTAEDGEISEDEKSLMRLKYLLQRKDPQNTALFLLNVAFKKSSAFVTTACQVRALRCLFSLVEDEIIAKMAKQSVSSLREHLKHLIYLGEFEALNIAMDLETFTASNKASLVRGLWKNHNHEPRCVRLICNLCLEYAVRDKHLWNSSLQQLQKFGMVDYLEYVLVELASVEGLRSLSCLPKVWATVLSAPFMSLCAPLSDHQASKCRSVLAALQKCPVVLDLDFVRLSCQFVRVELYAEALACLILMRDKAKKSTQINTLLDTRHVLVLDSLSQLKERKTPLPEHEQVVGEVYRHIVSQDGYETLLGTKHFMGLVHYLAKHDQLQGLVRNAVKINRIPDAIKIVHVYHSYYPKSPTNSAGSELDLLKGYLISHGLEDIALSILAEEEST